MNNNIIPKVILKVTDDDLKEYEELSKKLLDRFLDTDESPDKLLMYEAHDAIDWLITFVKSGEYKEE